MSDDLAACFDRFRLSAWRLETRSVYAVGAEAERIAAFREGRPLPERSVATSPWLRHLAETTAAGKTWSRVHVVDHPLSEYIRFELVTYIESALAGEVIRIAERRADPALGRLRADFWLFDAEGPHPFAALMSYNHLGEYLGSEVTTDPAVIADCAAQRALAERHSVPLAVYLAQLKAAAA